MISYRNLEFLDASLFGEMARAHFIVHRENNMSAAYFVKSTREGYEIKTFKYASRMNPTLIILNACTTKEEVLRLLPEGWTWPEFIVAVAMFEQGKNS